LDDWNGERGEVRERDRKRFYGGGRKEGEEKGRGRGRGKKGRAVAHAPAICLLCSISHIDSHSLQQLELAIRRRRMVVCLFLRGEGVAT